MEAEKERLDSVEQDTKPEPVETEPTMLARIEALESELKCAWKHIITLEEKFRDRLGL